MAYKNCKLRVTACQINSTVKVKCESAIKKSDTVFKKLNNFAFCFSLTLNAVDLLERKFACQDSISFPF